MTEFDKQYLSQARYVLGCRLRDVTLQSLGVDPEEFRKWQRESEVGNECDTDEYRETQPSKGLSYISDFFADWAPGIPACYEMFDLVKKWFEAGANMGEAYSGAAELQPILEMCFDFIWAKGGFSLYASPTDAPDEAAVESYKEALSA